MHPYEPQQIEEYHFLCGIKSILTQKKGRSVEMIVEGKKKKTFPLLLSLLLYLIYVKSKLLINAWNNKVLVMPGGQQT